MTHVMVDLETLGNKPGCKIMSIGAVVFGPSGLGAEFYMRIQRKSQGLLIEDPDTMEWWSKQSPEARAEIFGDDEARDAMPLGFVLFEFNEFLERVSNKDAKGNFDTHLWGNGADFDNAILQVALSAMDLEPSWKFWNNRCYRTLKGLYPGIKLNRAGTHHNALDDAKSQAEHAVRILFQGK
jgi:3' exoribonuclease, RNase T-like